MKKLHVGIGVFAILLLCAGIYAIKDNSTDSLTTSSASSSNNHISQDFIEKTVSEFNGKVALQSVSKTPADLSNDVVNIGKNSNWDSLEDSTSSGDNDVSGEKKYKRPEDDPRFYMKKENCEPLYNVAYPLVKEDGSPVDSNYEPVFTPNYSPIYALEHGLEYDFDQYKDSENPDRIIYN